MIPIEVKQHFCPYILQFTVYAFPKHMPVVLTL